MKKINNLNTFIEEFEKMKKAQNLLHILFVSAIISFLLLYAFGFITKTNVYIPIALLFIYAFWLIFANLYKQNQAFNQLKKIYDIVKIKDIKM